jgi:hypothetical protein
MFDMISFDFPPVPLAANRFQVGSSFAVQSMLPFKRFVNHICPAPWLLHPYSIDENIPMEDDVAYDCAANGNVIR